jgi:hypothetical protein
LSWLQMSCASAARSSSVISSCSCSNSASCIRSPPPLAHRRYHRHLRGEMPGTAPIDRAWSAFRRIDAVDRSGLPNCAPLRYACGTHHGAAHDRHHCHLQFGGADHA